jgi:hypothetical protein
MATTQDVIALDEGAAKARKDTLGERAEALRSFRGGRLADYREGLKSAWDVGGGSDVLAEAKECGELFAAFLQSAFLRFPGQCDRLSESIDGIMEMMGEVEADGVSDFGGQVKALEDPFMTPPVPVSPSATNPRGLSPR